MQRISALIRIDGYIDKFTSEKIYLEKPILKLDQIPRNAVVSVLGCPISAEAKLKKYGLKNLDYFSFYKYSGLDLVPIKYFNDFYNEFRNNI